MKIALFLIICSSMAGTCMPPFVHEKTYDNYYECLVNGYQMSLDKIVEIGKANINDNGIFIKFECKDLQKSYKKPSKMVHNIDLSKGLKNGH